MLDQETKRRIDTARDILVGKLPNPQSQVEQITIAMIYKFMDDMDKEAMEFGGEATFFTGDYEKYSWTKIFDPKLGGYEMLALYGEAIVKLNQNPNIPQLFRDIFKNAYLPYRDPETLKMFLKVINEFHYDHSEKLGDAFEYLLSVLGSQGDAGQFRTPRHIIDFMVAIMQPKKEESICDPACGTAGFLISSYKHILNKNTKKNKGDLLTPGERKKLITNFVGYDISSEMVRLSLANMYLHGFTSPKIYEYDTLTSTDRWGDTFDIIMANPPFMTPKGGIRPHKKFAMQANRSEVLFVDYIMEHINPITGRAAVIVPEGIIFQSATAYKALRKLLIEKNFLYGVVSLPAGLFQPYSGVKTSILLLDKTLAKKTEKILFVKIENDGYSLGAKRKELATSDLPDATNFINQYKKDILNMNPKDSNDYKSTSDANNTTPSGSHPNEMVSSSINIESLRDSKVSGANPNKQASSYANAQLVDKSRIAEKGDFNLSIDRYRIENFRRQVKHEWAMLQELCEMQTGSRDKGGALDEGIPSIGGEQISSDGSIKFEKMKYISQDHFNSLKKGVLYKNDVLLVKDGATTGKVGFYNGDYNFAAINEHVYLLRTNERINPFLFYHLLRSDDFQNRLKKFVKGIIGGISSEISQIEIPVPSIAEQQEIVSRIEQYEKIIAGAKQVVENYKPQIDVKPEWEMVELGKITTVKDGTHDSPQYYDSGIPFLTQKNITVNGLSFEDIRFIKKEDHEKFYRRSDVAIGDILISMIGANRGMSCIVNDSRIFSIKNVGLIKPSERINQLYLLNYLKSAEAEKYISLVSKGGAQEFISLTALREFPIPLPDLSIQEEIVSQIEKEQQLVNASKELIKIYEQKIKDEINKLWEE
ncbi:MAG: N-6 DNA methylase [Sphingobacteriales bacterium]|nr:N-6 DNA methylase [Sphingobacteriales bacterium]